MNTSTAVRYSAEHLWSRRCSIESALSIQSKETELVCDTSDTEAAAQHEEFEPVTDDEEAETQHPLSGDSSGESDNLIIKTKVIEVSVGDDGDLQLADSEQTDAEEVDSEVDLCDYWSCAQCHARNNNPLYRYCEKCYKVRKNFFPPRPKRKHKRPPTLDPETVPRSFSVDSGVESQELSQTDQPCSSQGSIANKPLARPHLKRRADSLDRNNKRIKVDFSDASLSDSDTEPVTPLSKTLSDPSLTIEEVKLTKKVISNAVKQKISKEVDDVESSIDKEADDVEKDKEKDDKCIICFSEPKSGVFVHGRIAHICCCYKCAVKVWASSKRCPVCNCRVSNVLKAVVM